MKRYSITKPLIVKYTLLLIIGYFFNFAFANSEHIASEANHLAGIHGEVVNKKYPLPTAKLNVEKIENKSSKKIVQIKLVRIKDNKPLKPGDLKTTHTEKLHLLIIDDSLEDYHHIHPKVMKEPGLYEFSWYPKKNVSYRMWADIFPLYSNQQEYVRAELWEVKNSKAEIKRTNIDEVSVGNLHFKLSFNTAKLEPGKGFIWKISINDKEGKPVTLEPVMGMSAHIVGFNEDLKTIIHVHPFDEEPAELLSKNVAELNFHINPEKSGFIKLFVQVRIQGKEIFVPFGLNV